MTDNGGTKPDMAALSNDLEAFSSCQQVKPVADPVSLVILFLKQNAYPPVSDFVRSAAGTHLLSSPPISTQANEQRNKVHI